MTTVEHTALVEALAAMRKLSFTPHEAALSLGLSEATINNHMRGRAFPVLRSKKYGSRKVLINVEDLIAWRDETLTDN